ncbi:MAG: hypothetical protein ACR2O0_07275 [Rhizobiaceae bacterium]
MPTFKNKSIGGQTYDLKHLEPFVFPLDVDTNQYLVRVQFSCHVFTEKYVDAKHTPDLKYIHRGELRAFDVRRHEFSIDLPNFIQSQGNRSVYHDKRGSFLSLEGLALDLQMRPMLFLLAWSATEMMVQMYWFGSDQHMKSQI